MPVAISRRAKEAKPAGTHYIELMRNISFVVMQGLDDHHGGDIFPDASAYENATIHFSSKYTLRGDNNDQSRLLHHFVMFTCETISDSKSSIVAWREIIPALAFEHDFLLSTLLAVTALHLAIIHPSEVHNNAALRHHTAALASFRRLSSIDGQNISAVFAFACMVPLFSFGLHLTPMRRSDTLSEIIEIFDLLRGISIVLKTGSKWLDVQQFPDAELPTVAKPAATLPDAIESTLLLLSRRNNIPGSDERLRVPYKAAIDMLRYSFLLSQEHPGKKLIILPFPILAPAEYISELKRKSPLALAILAHYAVLLHWQAGAGSVWLQTWGKHVVDAVKEITDEAWVDCIEWPLEQVNMVEDRMMIAPAQATET
jgi:hypothetical protein